MQVLASRRLLPACLALLCAACAHNAAPPPAATAQTTPPPERWYAPLPHGGDPAALAHWWQQFDDPLLVQLIEAAQGVSPTLASAVSRIDDARNARTTAGAGLLPTVDASASMTRSRQLQPGFGSLSYTGSQAGAQAAWEIDLFGAQRARRDAAEQRLEAARSAWHEARVSVAAEVALRYGDHRFCLRTRGVLERDLASRQETARLTALAAGAGFQAPAAAGLARASAADAAGRYHQQRAQCEQHVKALVALTGLSEPALRERLAAARADMTAAPPVAVASLPAALLAQRPDLDAAAREVAATRREIDAADAERLPQLTLGGSVGRTRLSGAGLSSEGTVWSIGPLTLAVPLFDGGRRNANADLARARYSAAAAAFEASARRAVREVEEALLALQSTAERGDDAGTAVEGFKQSFDAAEARYKGGLGSLFELEDARRSLLGAETARLSLDRERLGAWIALYRAVGGGWSAALSTQGDAQAALPQAANDRSPPPTPRHER